MGSEQKVERKGILKKSSSKAAAPNKKSLASKNSETKGDDSFGQQQENEREGERKVSQNDTKNAIKPADQGPAVKLQKEVETKVSDATKAELKKRIGDRHILDRGQEEIDEDDEIWDHSDDDASEINEKAGEVYENDGGNKEEDDDEEPTESK